MLENKIALKLRGETRVKKSCGLGIFPSWVQLGVSPGCSNKGCWGVSRALGVQELGWHGWEPGMGPSFAKWASMPHLALHPAPLLPNLAGS